MNRVLRLLAVFFVLNFLVACATTRHDWGDYSPELYSYYKSPTEEERAELLEALAQVFARVEEKGAVPAPGLYAEYGNFLFQKGDYPEAIEYFRKEKEAWPESSKFMDSLIAALQKRIPDESSQGLNNEDTPYMEKSVESGVE